MKLTGKQKRFLRANANQLRPIFSVGKNGLNATWLQEVGRAVAKRELVKVSIQQSADVSPAEVKQFIEANSEIQVVQTIGKTVLLFQEASQPNHRDISHGVFQL
ncbi:ribosome assembly RNA-binding protein YhbY [Fructilactobacillus myrtifloralis]|uniref:Ribosome assembly RNA-binding protein YhbY n=1 Tax=Fructilactobacillus myrtifloralis TaxID=2940301 RepID=A0ABY5BP43_9LACO|nr:ribosome assembly RNA-binding protein YhbY [Fructilactobacillus myrtifloralis]USS85249.1 ribosome assembly RNA-binding protein YhbY [Fructilactobacillus myrtifloralis]